MKIAIVTYYFYPDITPRAFRAFELAKQFARQNHDVVVVTRNINFDYKDIVKKYNFLVDARLSNVNIIPSSKSRLIKIIEHLISHYLLYPQILLIPSVVKVLKNYADYDLVLTIAHPFAIHFGSSFAKYINPKLCRSWIADCGDPFSGNKETRIKPPRYYKTLERIFFRNVSYITVPIDSAIAAYGENLRNKIRVIPQGFEIKSNSSEEKEFNSNAVEFAYAGVLGLNLRDPTNFLNYLTTINKNFKFTIYTENNELLNKHIKRLAGRLVVEKYIPRELLLDELSKMDFLINFENKNLQQSPSKLIDYAIIGRPVLSIPHKCNNFENFDMFMRGDFSQSAQLPDINDHDIELVANKFLNLVTGR